ncbi:hypothetical protein CGCSCA5_v011866 [Colletotrichum siamense]|nr:hypothetical protein CGCSCA5_v011866 [Colletotrichum siamense]
MNSEIGPPTDVTPEIALESVEKPTIEPATEPMTDPSPESKTGNETDLRETLTDMAIEPEANDGSRQPTRSDLGSTPEASTNPPSAARIALPPSPSPPTGFPYSDDFHGVLVPVDRSSTTKASYGDFGFPETIENPLGVDYSKNINIDPTAGSSDRTESQFCKDLETAAPGLSLDRCGTPDLATEASVVVTKNSAAALSDISDDDASYHTAPYYLSYDDTNDSTDDGFDYFEGPYPDTVYRIKKFQNRDFSEQQRDIISALDLSLQRDVPDAAERAAEKIDSLCPPSDQKVEVQDWLWMLWETVIDVVRFGQCYAVGYYIDQMFAILVCLQKRAHGYVKIEGVERRLWQDLPMFSYCMDAYLSDPTRGCSELDITESHRWTSLNELAARCLGSGVAGPYHHALDAMRSNLEEELSSDRWVLSTRMDVAELWIRHARKPILKWALENAGRTDPPKEDSMDYEESGPLYHGPPMMCLQRWGFWIERLEQLSKKDLGTMDLEPWDFHRDARRAAESLKQVEKEMGHTLSD